jgi:hypothetical protein
MGVVETLIHTFDVVRGLNPADHSFGRSIAGHTGEQLCRT